MNNQIGAVVAQVMATKDGRHGHALPSMIRVDAMGRMDFVYDEISEALGEEAGFFDAAEFEENMSTHYGRMIHEDDRTIMFANPEDAAEYIGFDLDRLAARPYPNSTYSQHVLIVGGDRVREGRREVLRRRQPHALLGREPGELGARARAVRQGLDRVLPRLPGPGPDGDALADREVPEVHRGRPDEGRVRGRPRGHRDLPADVPEGVVHRRLQHHRAQRRAGREAPGQVHRQHPLRPARRRRRPGGARAATSSGGAPRASSSTPPSGTTAPAARS